MKKPVFYLFPLFFLLLIINVTAQVSTLTSVQNGNWDDVNTWDLGRIPTSDDTVIIANSKAVTVNVQSVCSKLKITDGGISVMGDTLKVYDSLILLSGGSLAISSSYKVVVYGNVSNDGNINFINNTDGYFIFYKNYTSNAGTITAASIGFGRVICGSSTSVNSEHIITLTGATTFGTRAKPLNEISFYDSTQIITDAGDSLYGVGIKVYGGKITNSRKLVMGTSSASTIHIGNGAVDRAEALLDDYPTLQCPSTGLGVNYYPRNNFDITTGFEIPADRKVSRLFIHPLNDQTKPSNVIISGGDIICNIGVNFITNAGDSRKIILGNNNIYINTNIVGASKSKGYFVTNGTGSLKIKIAPNTTVKYPIGASINNYDSASLTFTAGSVADTFGVRVSNDFEHAPNDTSRIVKREWNITENTPGNDTATLSFTYESTTEKGGSYNNNGIMVIGHYDTTQNPHKWTEISASINGNTVSAGGFNFFSPFAVGNAGGLLPLNLISFNASRKQNEVLINWIVANEINNIKFDVQRSMNGVDYTSIATILGKNNTGAVERYEYIDKQIAAKNLLYYRLKQTDINGRYSYSPIVTVKFDNKQLYTILPNPVKDRLNIKQAIFNNEENKIEIYDTKGNKLYVSNIIMNGGTGSIDVSKLPPGNYIIHIIAGTNQNVISFIKL